METKKRNIEKRRMLILLAVIFCLFLPDVLAAAPTFFMDTIPTTKTLYEDVRYYYDINASDPDAGDNATLVFTDTTSLFAIGSSTGVVDFTPTNSQVGIYNATNNRTVDFIVKDKDDNGALASWGFEIVGVNDLPTLIVGNMTVYEDVLSGQDANSTDEEDGVESSGNLTFWGNSTLFNMTNTHTGTFSFTPDNRDVGTHYVNFSVNDTQGGVASLIIKITVVNVNDAPNLTWFCNENRSVVEDTPVFCYLNATDVDVGDSVSFSANYTWFVVNTTVQSIVSEKAFTTANFTPNDTAVGNWWINFTVNDSSGAADSKIVSFNVSNIPDVPTLPNMGSGFIAYVGVSFAYKVTAVDNDSITPGGDTVYYADNTSLFNINMYSGDINFTAVLGNVGIHYVNISANDTYGTQTSQIVNFTVVSDTIPTITMITNQSATEGTEFYYDFSKNVTDPDYNETMSYTDNSSLFNIGASTGIINFTADDENVGINWVNLSVTDAAGAKASVIVNFTVYNILDNPVLTNITNITTVEDFNYYYDVNASDGDLNIPSGNVFGINEALYFSDNTTLFNISSSTGTFNFTVTNNNNTGIYWINISVNDTLGGSTSAIINITVSAVNDMPILTPIVELNATQGSFYFYDANATDEEDGGENSNNLTFWSNATIFNITNTRTGTFNLTPSNRDVGAHYVNFSVNDTQGGIDSEIFRINVANINDVPSLVATLPTNYNQSTNENTNITFVGQGEDADGDTMTYLWYDGSQLRETDSAISGSQNYVFDANYTSEGWHNITLILSDNKANVSYSWNLTVNHTNAPVKFTSNISNITWTQGTSYTSLDLDTHFSDVDRDDPLYNQTFNTSWVHLYTNWTVMDSNLSHITVSVNNVTNVVTFTPSSSWSGLESLYFIVNDSITQKLSNNFTMNVSETITTTPTTTPTTTSSGGGGGGGGASTKYESLNIIHPGNVSMYSDGVIVTPLRLTNQGTKVLTGVKLTTTGTLLGLGVSLDKDYIAKISPGENITVNMILRGLNLTLGEYEAGVEASVSSPSLKDSVKFFIQVIKEGEMKAKTRKQLVFVHEFMKTNPECLELEEVLTKAEEVFEKEDYALALKIAEQVVQSCKEVIRRERLPYIPKQTDILGILSIAGLFLAAFFTILGIYEYIRKKKIQSGWFFKNSKRRRE